MQHHTTWLTPADCALFEQFLATVQKGLRPTWEAELPDGVGDAEADLSVLSYALQRAQRFAAFRWAEQQEGDLIQWELFFVAPASSSAHLGLRAAHPRLSAPTLPVWLSTLLPNPQVALPSQPFPGFMELVSLLSSRGRVATTSAVATQVLLEQQSDLEYQRQLSDDLAGELRQVNGKLRDVMAVRTAATQFEDPDTTVDAPDAPRDLSALRAWSLANESRIILLPRALQGAKKSRYDTPETVFTALELLAGPYRELRRGQLEHAQFLEALSASEMQLEGSVGVSVAGEQGDAYFVTWKGRRRFLELHLRKGGGRDERYCLRIYFFWDDQSQKVVVGWLPSHLSNSLS